MPKIIPEITNGTRRLVLSETILMVLREPLVIQIPIAPTPLSTAENILTLKISFSDELKHNSWLQPSPLTIELRLKNFVTERLSTMSEPLEFGVGGSTFHIFLSFMSTGEKARHKLVQVTLTVYEIRP